MMNNDKSIEAYVVVSNKKYETILDELKQLKVKPLEKRNIETIDEVSVDNKVPGDDLTKEVKKSRLSTFVELFEEEFPEKSKEFDNLEKLVKGALTQSPKHLKGEEEFYDMLINSNLSHRVENKQKIKQYFPTWMRIKNSS